MKIYDIMKELKIKQDDIYRFLKRMNLPLNLNNKLDFNVEKILRDSHKVNSSLDEIIGINEYINDESITVLKKNIFTNQPLYDIMYNGKIINSFFSDENACKICLRTKDNKLRRIAKELFRNTVIEPESRYIIHLMANKLLSQYGGFIITFLLELNLLHLPYTEKTQELSINLNSIDKTLLEFPRMQLDYNFKESYILKFEIVKEKNLSKGIVTVRNIYSTNRFSVGRDGKVMRENKYEEMIPEIALFKKTIEDCKLNQLYCGYYDGLCDICGRPLEDYISIKYGRGPICRTNFGTPF